MLSKLVIFQDRKLLLKVIAGILLLVIAFSVYLNKNSNSQDIEIEEPLLNEIEEEVIPNEEALPEISNIIIDVSGYVVNPSVISLPEGSRVFEAIDLAGGLKEDGDTRNINLAQILNDGEKLYIPSKKEIDAGLIPISTNNITYTNTGGQSNKININTADSNALQQLNGVGPSTADKIIQYRNEYGNFSKIEDLKNVSGIGDKTFEKLKEKITV